MPIINIAEGDFSRRADNHSSTTARTVARLPEAQQQEFLRTGWVDNQPVQLNLEKTIEVTGSEYQRHLLNNSSDHVNKSPRHFQGFCKQLHQKFGSNFKFGVALLAGENPLTFADAQFKQAQVGKETKKFLGQARVVYSPTYQAFTLKIEVIGARLSQILQPDLVGLSLATSVATRDTTANAIQQALVGECSGSQIQGLGDLKHVATALPAITEAFKGTPPVIRQALQSTQDKPLTTVANVSHIHDLSGSNAAQLQQTLMTRSRTLSAVGFEPDQQNMWTVNPNLSDPVLIIPDWKALQQQPTTSELTSDQATYASIALGLISSITVDGIARLSEEVISPSNAGNIVRLDDVRHLMT